MTPGRELVLEALSAGGWRSPEWVAEVSGVPIRETRRHLARLVDERLVAEDERQVVTSAGTRVGRSFFTVLHTRDGSL